MRNPQRSKREPLAPEDHAFHGLKYPAKQLAIATGLEWAQVDAFSVLREPDYESVIDITEHPKIRDLAKRVPNIMTRSNLSASLITGAEGRTLLAPLNVDAKEKLGQRLQGQVDEFPISLRGGRLGQAAIFGATLPKDVGMRFIGFCIEGEAADDMLGERNVLLKGIRNSFRFKQQYVAHISVASTPSHRKAASILREIEASRLQGMPIILRQAHLELNPSI
jgi:hypothetical protein